MGTTNMSSKELASKNNEVLSNASNKMKSLGYTEDQISAMKSIMEGHLKEFSRLILEKKMKSEAIDTYQGLLNEMLSTKHDFEKVITMLGSAKSKAYDESRLVQKSLLIDTIRSGIHWAAGFDKNDMKKTSATTNFMMGALDSLLELPEFVELVLSSSAYRSQVMDALKNISIDAIKQEIARQFGDLKSGDAYQKGYASTNVIFTISGLGGLVKGMGSLGAKLSAKMAAKSANVAKDVSKWMVARGAGYAGLAVGKTGEYASKAVAWVGKVIEAPVVLPAKVAGKVTGKVVEKVTDATKKWVQVAKEKAGNVMDAAKKSAKQPKTTQTIDAKVSDQKMGAPKWEVQATFNPKETQAARVQSTNSVDAKYNVGNKQQQNVSVNLDGKAKPKANPSDNTVKPADTQSTGAKPSVAYKTQAQFVDANTMAPNQTIKLNWKPQTTTQSIPQASSTPSKYAPGAPKQNVNLQQANISTLKFWEWAFDGLQDVLKTAPINSKITLRPRFGEGEIVYKKKLNGDWELSNNTLKDIDLPVDHKLKMTWWEDGRFYLLNGDDSVRILNADVKIHSTSVTPKPTLKERLQNNIKQRQERALEAKKTELETLNTQKIPDKQKELDVKQSQIDEFNKNNDALRTKIDQKKMIDDIPNMEASLKQAQESLDKLKNINPEVRKILEKRVKDLETKISDAKKLAPISESVDDMLKTLKTQEKDVAKLAKEYNVLEKEMQNMKKYQRKLDADVNPQKEVPDVKTSETSRLQQMKDKTAERFKEWKETKWVKIQERWKEWKTRENPRAETLKSLKVQQEILENEIKTLKSSMKWADKATKESLKQQIALLDDTLKVVKSDISANTSLLKKSLVATLPVVAGSVVIVDEMVDNFNIDVFNPNWQQEIFNIESPEAVTDIAVNSVELTPTEEGPEVVSWVDTTATIRPEKWRENISTEKREQFSQKFLTKNIKAIERIQEYIWDSMLIHDERPEMKDFLSIIADLPNVSLDQVITLQKILFPENLIDNKNGVDGMFGANTLKALAKRVDSEVKSAQNSISNPNIPQDA